MLSERNQMSQLLGVGREVEEARAVVTGSARVTCYQIAENTLLYVSNTAGLSKLHALHAHNVASGDIVAVRDAAVREGRIVKGATVWAFTTSGTNGKRFRGTLETFGCFADDEPHFKLTDTGEFEYIGKMGKSSALGTSRYLVQECRDFVAVALIAEASREVKAEALRRVAQRLKAYRKLSNELRVEIEVSLNCVADSPKRRIREVMQRKANILQFRLNRINRKSRALSRCISRLTQFSNDALQEVESEIVGLRESEREVIVSRYTRESMGDIAGMASYELILDIYKRELTERRARLSSTRQAARRAAKSLFQIEAKQNVAERVRKCRAKKVVCPLTDAITKAQKAYSVALQRQQSHLVLKHSNRLVFLKTQTPESFAALLADDAQFLKTFDASVKASNDNSAA